jgi:uncharacterized protein YdaT
MPWSGETFGRRHNRGLTKRESGKAAEVANAILRETGDEGKAIRIANWMVKRNRYGAGKKGAGSGEVRGEGK